MSSFHSDSSRILTWLSLIGVIAGVSVTPPQFVSFDEKNDGKDEPAREAMAPSIQTGAYSRIWEDPYTLKRELQALMQPQTKSDYTASLSFSNWKFDASLQDKTGHSRRVFESTTLDGKIIGIWLTTMQSRGEPYDQESRMRTRAAAIGALIPFGYRLDKRAMYSSILCETFISETQCFPVHLLYLDSETVDMSTLRYLFEQGKPSDIIIIGPPDSNALSDLANSERLYSLDYPVYSPWASANITLAENSYIRRLIHDEELIKKAGDCLRQLKGRTLTNRVLLLYEADSVYASKLLSSITVNLSKGNLFDIQNQYYIRGLGGGRSPSIPSSQLLATPVSQEETSGPAQYDILRRTAVDLGQRFNGDCMAIGILGTDAKDKVLLVNALKSEFPNAIFFSTDLDSIYMRNDCFSVVSNSIFFSFYPLNNDFMAFRDCYQYGTFHVVQQIASGATEIQPFTAKAFQMTRYGPKEFTNDYNEEFLTSHILDGTSSAITAIASMIWAIMAVLFILWLKTYIHSPDSKDAFGAAMDRMGCVIDAKHDGFHYRTSLIKSLLCSIIFVVVCVGIIMILYHLRWISAGWALPRVPIFGSATIYYTSSAVLLLMSTYICWLCFVCRDEAKWFDQSLSFLTKYTDEVSVVTSFDGIRSRSTDSTLAFQFRSETKKMVSLGQAIRNNRAVCDQIADYLERAKVEIETAGGVPFFSYIKKIRLNLRIKRLEQRYSTLLDSSNRLFKDYVRSLSELRKFETNILAERERAYILINSLKHASKRMEVLFSAPIVGSVLLVLTFNTAIDAWSIKPMYLIILPILVFTIVSGLALRAKTLSGCDALILQVRQRMLIADKLDESIIKDMETYRDNAFGGIINNRILLLLASPFAGLGVVEAVKFASRI